MVEFYGVTALLKDIKRWNAMEKTEGTGVSSEVGLENAPQLAQEGGSSGMGRLVSTEELTQVLGVTEQVVRKLVKDKKIPAYRLERVLRFDLGAVLESLKVK